MNKVRLILENGKHLDIEVYEDIAPISASNFLKLVDAKYYDGVIFHRIIRDFMVQTGGYKLDGDELYEADETASIKGEFQSNGVKNDLKHTLGVVSMARTSIKDSASSQFFICTADAPHLNGEYAAFGKVVGEESYKVLEELNQARTEFISNMFADFPYPIIKIKTIERI